MQSGGSRRDSPGGAVLAAAVAVPPLRLPAAGRRDAPQRGRPGATHAQPGAAQGGAARGQVLEGPMTMGRASVRCGTRKSARWTENLRGVEAGRRRGRRPRSFQRGDIELCRWGWRGDMYAPMVSKFQWRNYRPPGVRRAFAICGLEEKGSDPDGENFATFKRPVRGPPALSGGISRFGRARDTPKDPEPPRKSGTGCGGAGFGGGALSVDLNEGHV